MAEGARLLRCLDLFDDRPGAAADALVERRPELRVETLREGVETHLLLTDRGDEEALAQGEAWLRAELGPLLYGADAETLPMATARALAEAKLQVVFAESLTAGLASARLAEAPGASEVLLGAAVTYATRLKSSWLGVSPAALAASGPVCAEVAGEMAEGARRLARADLALSLTGWAGPDPGPDGQPAGTVYLGLAAPGAPTHVEHDHFAGTRAEVRQKAAHRALDLLRRHALGLEYGP